VNPVLTEQELDLILAAESHPYPAEWEDDADRAEQDILSMIGKDGFLWTSPEFGVKAQYENDLSSNPRGTPLAVHTPPIKWEAGKPEVLPKQVLLVDPSPIVSDRLEIIRNETERTVTFRSSDGRHVCYSCLYRDGKPLLSEADATHLGVIMYRLRNL
jgi:hypothetical protein